MIGDRMIRESLDILVGDGITELRVISENGISSGYYSDLDRMAKDAEIIDGYQDTTGVYFVLNSVNVDLLARRSNRLKQKLSKKDATTADQDIVRRYWLPIDLDPIRPSGVSSTDAEHQAALDKARKIMLFLHENGWSIPIIADSGNGAHLLYRIDLLNDDESKNLIKKCLENLNTLFSDESVTVDTSVFNAARIWKLYGTISRKGDNTQDRPHRRSEIISVGDYSILSIDHLKWLSNVVPSEPDKVGPQPKPVLSESGIDVEDWLVSHRIGYERKPYSDGELFVLNECPFSSAHKDGAYVIQFSSGAIFAGCHHNSCGSGSQRWSELRAMYESRKPEKNIDDRYSEFKKKGIVERAKGKINQVVADISKISKELKDEVKEILKGDPIKHMLDSFGKDHEGDQIVAECMIMSLASRNVINSKGLHVSITGESGKGKSHACSTMLKQVPEQVKMADRMSDKALFYMEAIQPKTVVVLDDMALSEQMSEVLKGVSSNFQKEFGYRTVSKDRKGMKCVIPERCVWWVAKVEGAGDDQVFNRMLNVWIDDTIDQDERVLTRALDECSQLPNTFEGENEENLISQQIWNCLKDAWVVIPYGKRIRFSTASNRRNPDMLIDLIRSNAILKQYQRKQEEINGTHVVYADVEDFETAKDLYNRLNQESGGQGSKLTRKESELIKAIRKSRLSEFSTQQLQTYTGFSHSSINKLMHGYTTRGVSYSGLLEKCPAVAFCERSITLEDEGTKTSRKTRVYTFDEKMYEVWNHFGSVWLEDDKDEPENENKPQIAGGGESGCFLQDADLSRTETDPVKSSNHDNNNNNNNNNNCTASTDLTIDQIHKPNTVYDCKVAPHGPIRNTDPAVDNSCNKDRVENLPRRQNLDNPPIRQVVNIDELKSKDYRITYGNGPGGCSGCGSNNPRYIEGLTERRKVSKDPPQKLCESCYQKIKKRETDYVLSNPDSLGIDKMKGVSTVLDTCVYCNKEKVSWYNFLDRRGVCECCYNQLEAVSC